jgi:hypothetical protein
LGCLDITEKTYYKDAIAELEDVRIFWYRYIFAGDVFLMCSFNIRNQTLFNVLLECKF